MEISEAIKTTTSTVKTNERYFYGNNNDDLSIRKRKENSPKKKIIYNIRSVISFPIYIIFGSPFLLNDSLVLLSEEKFRNKRTLNKFERNELVYVYDTDKQMHIQVQCDNLKPFRNNHIRYIQNKQTFDSFFAIAPLLIKCNTLHDYKRHAQYVGVHYKTLQRWAAIFRRTYNVFDINRHKETRSNLKQNRLIDHSLELLIQDQINIHYTHESYFPLQECYLAILQECKRVCIEPPSKATVYRRIVSQYSNIKDFRHAHKHIRNSISYPGRPGSSIVITYHKLPELGTIYDNILKWSDAPS